MMPYKLHIIQLPTTKSLQKRKNLQFVWCLQNSCTQKSTEDWVYFWKIYTGMVSEPICPVLCLTSSLQDHS